MQTNTSHRHNTIPPFQTLVQSPYPLPTYTTHATATKTQTHVQHYPCSHRIGKAQTQSSHPLISLSTHAAPSQTHTHLTYSTNSSHPTHHTHPIQNPFLTAQSTQIESVISVPIKDFIHHYPRALFNDIPRVGAHFYDIPGSGRKFTTYPGRGAV